MVQTVKNLPARQETWVQSLCTEDPLEMGMATHSSILAWRIPWTEKPGGLQSMGCKQSDTTQRLTHVLYAHYIYYHTYFSMVGIMLCLLSCTVLSHFAIDCAHFLI